ncbi:MAG: methionyl-tRNA formyltransferase, partial [Janthinobacterium sp.]|jgi:methionyl-tRNA formyltransferase
LPKYRGASPIHSALINGDVKTGNTITIMDAEMDHGPVLATSEILIEATDDFKSLEKKMSEDGANLLVETLSGYLNGVIKPREQDHSLATYTKLISKEDGLINWQNSPERIFNQWRAYRNWPGVYSYFNDKNGKKIKVILNVIKKAPAVGAHEAGTIIFNQGQMFIAVGEVSIEVVELTVEGKKTMSAKEFFNGYQYLNGQRFV